MAMTPPDWLRADSKNAGMKNAPTEDAPKKGALLPLGSYKTPEGDLLVRVTREGEVVYADYFTPAGAVISEFADYRGCGKKVTGKIRP